ncbi:MAG: carboxypeptidase-like regulatory domain-containing protein [Gemmatimonadaceae bacterium]
MLAASLMLATGAQGQAVRGTIITPDSLLVSGVIVTLIDSNGTPVARALADDGGRFTMRAPTAGTYHIEAKRLAFRPTIDTPIVLPEGRVLLHTLVLRGAPVQLDAVRVTAEQSCQAQPDSGTMAFSVWEEARKALRASQLTRLTRAYKVDVTTYVRKKSTGFNRERGGDSSNLSGMSLRPFTSRPAEELAERGYITRGPHSAVYHAPDEDVLLSESFGATHCLRILPDSGGDDMVRLAFSPIPGRRQTDIAGVLSIDRASSELRRLDFTFVNLPPLDVVGTPGGEIVFRRLPEGSWLIEQWAIWFPFAEQRNDLPPALPVPNSRVPVRQTPVMTTRYGLQTTGGHVNRVAAGEETLWLRPAPTP